MVKRVKWNSEKIVSISAIAISFITLLIFIYQTNLMSRQNYLSILPYVLVSTSDNSANNTYKITLDNYGVGPAILEGVTMSYQGQVEDLGDYDNEFLKYLKAKTPALDSIQGISYSTLDKGVAIPPGEEYNILTIYNSEEDYKLYKGVLLDLLKNGLDFEIRYKSIQEEHWKINSSSRGPIKIE